MAGDAAAPSQMEQSVDVGSALLQLVRSDSAIVLRPEARSVAKGSVPRPASERCWSRSGVQELPRPHRCLV
jgi:hypothetical protein